MNKDQIFRIWAPEGSPWSCWVKPVLFAYLDAAPFLVTRKEVLPDTSWSPSSQEKKALVLDLPGAEGVDMGLALAARGFRPIPLYNAIPLPFGEPSIDPITRKQIAMVNVLPIIQSLGNGSEILDRLMLPEKAPPAFLLDANRSGSGRRPEPDEFDNRSVSFTTDFPSANFLAAQGIDGIVLVQKDRLEPHTDLAHSLRRWQDAGLWIGRKQLDSPSPSEPFIVRRPSWYGVMFQRALLSMGLRRSGTGGFGGWVPESAAGG